MQSCWFALDPVKVEGEKEEYHKTYRICQVYPLKRKGQNVKGIVDCREAQLVRLFFLFLLLIFLKVWNWSVGDEDEYAAPEFFIKTGDEHPRILTGLGELHCS